MKATRDFVYASIPVQAGQSIPPGTFEADQVQSLIRKGWITEEPIKEKGRTPSAPTKTKPVVKKPVRKGAKK
jgi:hypothetical protein